MAAVVALAALVGWVMVLGRLPYVRLASAQARYTFATLASFTLAATFSISPLGIWAEGVVQLPGLRLILPYTLAVLAAAMWAMVCVSLEPSLRPRRWLAKAAPLVWLALLGVWYAYLPDMQQADSVEASNGGLLLNALLHLYGGSIIVGISLPAMGRRIGREPTPAIRLRLAFILATQVILGVWLGARMLLSPMILLGLLPRDFSFGFVSVLIGLLIVTFSISLLPPRAFEVFVRTAERLRLWRDLYRAVKLERHAARLLGQPAVELPAAEILRTPDFALYRVVIAILDRRKALRQSSALGAGRLAWMLDDITRQAPSYPELVTRLSHLEPRAT